MEKKACNGDVGATVGKPQAPCPAFLMHPFADK